MSGRQGEEASAQLQDATFGILLTLALGVILYFAREVLVPLALAILLSFALSPVVRALQKIGAPRSLAAVAALAMFMAALAVWVWFVSSQLSDLADRLPAYQHNIHDKIHGLADRFSSHGGKADGVSATIDDLLKEVTPAKEAGPPPQRVVVVDNSPISRISVLGSFATPILSPLAQFIIVLVFTVFLLAQQEDLRNRVIKLIGPNDIYRTTEAIDDAGRRVGRMLFAQVVMNSAFGIIIALSLWFIGVPNSALWGAIAALARFVPYIGVAVGTLPPLLVAFAFDPGWTSFLLTLGVFVVAESITGQVIEPIVYGHSSGLSPTAVVIAASVWAFLWGPIGLVLSTPLTTCLVVLGRHAPGMEFLETLLGNEPPLTAHETFYQRMLAGDPREAASQARSYLKRGAIADYYDEVALEALRRAHVDVGRGDLDEARLNALTQSTTQLVAWLGAAGEKGDRRALLQRFLRLIRRAGPKTALAEREALQDELLRSRRGVAVLYGDHPLDSIAAAMLTHALSRRGLPSRSVSKDEANVATVEQCASVGLVCLCYIEPLTVAHLRAAAVAARRRCPQAKVMICVWRDPSDDKFTGMERRLRADAIATGIGGAASAALRLLGVSSSAWALSSSLPGFGAKARAA